MTFTTCVTHKLVLLRNCWIWANVEINQWSTPIRTVTTIVGRIWIRWVFSTFAYSIYPKFQDFIRQLRTWIISKTDDEIYFWVFHAFNAFAYMSFSFPHHFNRNGIKDNSKIHISFDKIRNSCLLPRKKRSHRWTIKSSQQNARWQLRILIRSG